MKLFITLIFLLLLNGCSQYSIRNIDKPPPEDYETWRKQGVSPYLGIKKALLECGKVSIGRVSKDIYEKVGLIEQKEQFNHDFLVDRCMLNAGFVHQNTRLTYQDLCADSRYRDYPACQPDAIIPTPSVERRLNSWYCRVATDYNFCLENALAPKLCSAEENRKLSPQLPPECLTPEEERQGLGSNCGAASQLSLCNISAKKQGASINYETQEHLRRELEQQQLQRDTQNQNNRQMKDLLKSTLPKTGR